MTELPEISGPDRAPASGRPARQLVVLLHGWGADGNDLIGLAPQWAARLPDARFVSPHAPDVCDANPMGRQWFAFQDREPHEIMAGVVHARAVIDRYLDTVLAEMGLAEDRLALAGFSQGAMMALDVALRRAAPCAAVIGFSGRLLSPETLAGEIRARPPVFLAHGEADPVVPFAELADAVAVLGANDVAVRWHATPGLGHGIDPTGLEIAADLLADTLGE